YLVVQYDGGEEKQCIFKREEQVDALLDHIRSIRPEMPVHSVQAEKKLLEKQRILEQKKARIAFSDARGRNPMVRKMCAVFGKKT
ncbi:ATPase P, partial [Mediterraneibacter gnavus]